MLAASPPCSQVPPDHLQAAPVLVFLPFFAHQLGKSLPIIGLESEPCKSGQDDATRKKCCPNPTTIRRQDCKLAIVFHAYALTSLIPVGNYEQFAGIHEQPDDRGGGTPGDRNRQSQNHRDTEHGRRHSGNDDNAAQQGLRSEFGRVCVR